MLDQKLINILAKAQQNEITEHFIYKKLASIIKEDSNKKILIEISNDELVHYSFWKTFTKIDVKPNKLQVWKYFLISKFFGIIFGLKLMESGEKNAQNTYDEISKFVPDVQKIIKDEEGHENKLINLLREDRVKYIGSVVLGINDALVELTGSLAGLTFAFQDTRLIAMAGLVTGVAASLSMAASEYFSKKVEQAENPVKASIYTGLVYMVTVVLLILPYLLLSNVYLALVITLLIGVFVVFLFNYYISVIQGNNFRRNFLQMVAVILGVATFSFLIGYIIRIFFGVSV